MTNKYDRKGKPDDAPFMDIFRMNSNQILSLTRFVALWMDWQQRRKERRWIKDMNVRSLTDRQIRLFGEMLAAALRDIRHLGWEGKSEQAAALADAFHNLPAMMYTNKFSFVWFRGSLEHYHDQYPYNRSESLNDYLVLLEKVIREQEILDF